LNLLTLPVLCSTNPNVNQGPNKTLMHGLDRILRSTILSGGDAVDGLLSPSGYGLVKSMSPQDAMEVLMRPLINEGTSRDVEIGYVRHDNVTKGLYNRSRSYAIGLTVKQKFQEALQKCMQLEEELAVVRRIIARMRWKSASASVLSGKCLLSLERTSYRTMCRVFCSLLRHQDGRPDSDAPQTDCHAKGGWREAGRECPGMDKRDSLLSNSIDEHVAKSKELECQFLALKPYIALLGKAIEVGGSNLSATVCEQSGFQGLNELQEGRKPTCCICLAPVDEPTVTRCVHLACNKCILAWLDASAVLNQKGNNTRRLGGAPCPLCRQEFTLRDLIRITLDDNEEKTSTTGNARKRRRMREHQQEGDSRSPTLCAAIEEEDFESLDLPDILPARDPRFPALSRHMCFLAHLQEAKADAYVTPKEDFIYQKLGEKQPQSFLNSLRP